VGLDNYWGCLLPNFLLDHLSSLASRKLPARWYAAVGLIVLTMTVNGLSNYVIFRARNLYLSFVIGAVFPILDLTLFTLLLPLDQPAALALIPYLLYRVYAVFWGYGLWRVINRRGSQIEDAWAGRVSDFVAKYPTKKSAGRVLIPSAGAFLLRGIVMLSRDRFRSVRRG
jgi:hypothetical protein